MTLPLALSVPLFLLLTQMLPLVLLRGPLPLEKFPVSSKLFPKGLRSTGCQDLGYREGIETV
jgi:hypothetical protein